MKRLGVCIHQDSDGKQKRYHSQSLQRVLTCSRQSRSVLCVDPSTFRRQTCFEEEWASCVCFCVGVLDHQTDG